MIHTPPTLIFREAENFSGFAPPKWPKTPFFSIVIFGDSKQYPNTPLVFLKNADKGGGGYLS